MSQEEVLALLKTFGPLRAADLKQGTGLAHSSVHQSLKRLRKQGEIRWMQGKSQKNGGNPCVWMAI